MRGRSLGITLLGVATLIAACASSTPPPPPAVAVDAPVASLAMPAMSASAKPPKPAVSARPIQADLPKARSWLEPEVVDRLAVDCHWTPKDLDGGESETRNPMSCRLAYVQSCSPDPCSGEKEDECKPECTKTCGGCASKCTTGCESCKSKCTDDTCRHDCAQQCATCRDTCLQEVDKCQTGVCGGKYSKCGKATDAELKKPVCRAACSAVQRCNTKCSELNEDDPCVAACKKKFSASCMEKLFWYCAIVGHP